MFFQSRARHAAGSIVLASAALVAGAVAAQPAAAASTTTSCQASTLNLSLLGSTAVSANIANAANTPCVADHDGNDVTGLGSITASAIDSATATTPGVSAGSEAKIVGLHADASNVASGLVTPLTSGSTSILPAVSAAIGAQLGAGGSITTALAPLHALGLNLGSTNTVNLGTDLTGTLPTALSATLPDLVDTDLIDTQSSATCHGGVATLSGHITITGLSVLGESIDVNSTVAKTLSLNTESLTLSQLVSVEDVLKSITVQPSILTDVANALGSTTPSNLYDVLTSPLLPAVNPHLPTGTTVSTILSAVDAAVAPVLASTTVPLPSGILSAVVTPQTSVTDGVTETDTALTISISGLGQTLLSGYLARGSVNVDAASCETPPAPTPTPKPTPTPTPNPEKGFNADAMLKWQQGPAAAALECTGTKLRLIDVRGNGNQTLIKGVADSSLIGQTATIYATYGNKKVGTTKVDAQGLFGITAPLPTKSIRSSNSARYYAIIDGQRTGALKFHRRMYTTTIAKSGSKVTYSGYITKPFAKTNQTVVIQRRVSCGKYVKVASTKTSPSGKFSVSFPEASGTTAAIYRAQTAVPKRAASARLYATYTLPVPLAL